MKITICLYLQTLSTNTFIVRFEPSRMNSDINKAKRAAYVQNAVEAIGNGRMLIYVDESN